MRDFKINYSILPLMIICSFFIALTSCKKENTASPAQEKIDRLDNDLKNINSKYSSRQILSQSGSSFNSKLLASSNRVTAIASGGPITTPPDPTQPTETGFSFKKFCAVFSADVGGAWAGSWAGGKIGAAVGSLIPGAGTGAGATAGAIAGGVIVGAAASYAASDVIPDTTLNLLPTPVPVAPIGEESADEGHNRVLDLLISSSSAPVPVGDTSNSVFNTTYLTNNESVIASNCQTLINNTISTFAVPEIGTSKSYVSANITDNFITTVSNNFFDGLELLQTPADVLNFIDSYEDYVTNTTNLDETQKENIQVALEASKGSLSFWSPLIGQ